MKRILTFCKGLCLSTFLLSQTINSYQAVTIVPVADLVGSALTDTHDYAALPICGGKPKAYATCKRLHQLLFNETVEVTQEHNGQVEVTLPHLFFVPNNDLTHKMATYWTLKKNIIPLKDPTLKALVPQPISYKKPLALQHNVITLTKPYFVDTCGCTFSAGTRFIATATNPETKTITVSLIHPKKHTPTQVTIPFSHCLTPATTPEQQRKNYVKLIRLWAHDKGAIPYVWGGCSYVFKSPHFAFKEITTGTNQTFYTLEPDTSSPKTGFDCAGLVARAAQAAGLPYFFKNTTTLATYLQPLAQNEHVQDGDLIWIPGHVMIISNKEHHKLIEARDYSSGWGCIQELPLKEVFKNIHNYNDLETCFKQKKTLLRIDKSGNISNTYASFKLLSLTSLWS